MNPFSLYTWNVIFPERIRRIKRAIRFFWQRRTRGWDDSETWNMDIGVANYLLPRLRRYKQITKAYPANLKNPEEWDVIIDKIICAFELIILQYDIDVDDIESIGTIESCNKINEGLDLFRQYFSDLWW